MILIAHIFIALASLFATTLGYFSPTRLRLRLSQSLLVATVASGSYLLISMETIMLQTCMVGLFYVGFISLGIAATSRRLSRQHELVWRNKTAR